MNKLLLGLRNEVSKDMNNVYGMEGRWTEGLRERFLATKSNNAFALLFIFHISCRYSERWGDVKGYVNYHHHLGHYLPNLDNYYCNIRS